MATVSSSPQIVKGFIALLVAAGCLGLLVFLLTPVGTSSRSALQPSSDVITVRPPVIEGPVLVRA
jgi:hypothetical protein